MLNKVMKTILKNPPFVLHPLFANIKKAALIGDVINSLKTAHIITHAA
jgi:hypothetical protein